MKTVYVDDTPRKCGNLVKRGCYGGSELSDKGTLALVVYTLAEMWPSAEKGMIYPGAELPDRFQVEINPRLSLATGSLRLYDSAEEQGRGSQPEGIDRWGLADHVGQSFYNTPIDFIRETKDRGLSRRFTKDNARKWASEKRAPFPVLFAHRCVPVFKDQVQAERFILWAWDHDEIPVDGHLLLRLVAEGVLMDDSMETIGDVFTESDEHVSHDVPCLDWSPTWEQPKWGMGATDYHGTEHPGLIVLDALDVCVKKKITVPEEFFDPCFTARQIFMAAWVTHIIQIVDDEDEVDADLAEAGVDAGIVVTYESTEDL